MMFRFDPFRELGGLQSELNRIFDRASQQQPQQSSAGQHWTPPVDVYEDEGGFVIQAELPGLTREDIELHLENRTLTLRGERKMEKNLNRENYHQLERAYGRFARSFTLPQSIEHDKISASFKDGVLNVVLPKAEEVKPKTIKISAG